ncbi:hypothetical protein SNOG_07965 [Parastagonospora nodorum SN15]|uniref:Uncharacterized protein n=1 Tax=Phaeosphaeria nodorum (strain SN15 / ATCC MYA-4574 / FGSC 10173) TaxID=321614 RepID=Q0UJU9_PHANO|nr:hypothetical protein SNOG_07965 [Parastagonospora nodorum SN15]EAT84241.1 hypothetical protein SNOG_07965 [Parastagonospora nodorum SN15]
MSRPPPPHHLYPTPSTPLQIPEGLNPSPQTRHPESSKENSSMPKPQNRQKRPPATSAPATGATAPPPPPLHSAKTPSSANSTT